MLKLRSERRAIGGTQPVCTCCCLDTVTTAPDEELRTPESLVSPNTHTGSATGKAIQCAAKSLAARSCPKEQTWAEPLHCKTSCGGAAEPQSSSHHKGNAERGLRTLRQACYQEIPGSAMCVQNLDDSRGLAIRITYRISLRSSSLWEPRHPLLKVVRHSRLVRGRLSLVTEVSHAETHSLFLQIVWSMPVMLKRSARLHLLLLLE